MRSTSSRFWVAKTTAPPRAAQRGHALPQAPPLVGVERRGRLVEQQHLRVAEQRDGEVQPLAVADREVRARRGLAGQLERLEQPLGRRARVVLALEPREQLQVLARGQAPVLRGPLRRPADARALAPLDLADCSPRARRRAARAASTCRRRSGRRARARRRPRPRARPARARSSGRTAGRRRGPRAVVSTGSTARRCRRIGAAAEARRASPPPRPPPGRRCPAPTTRARPARRRTPRSPAPRPAAAAPRARPAARRSRRRPAARRSPAAGAGAARCPSRSARRRAPRAGGSRGRAAPPRAPRSGGRPARR